MASGNYVVQTGVCIDPNDGEYQQCVVDPTHCQADHPYLSAREAVAAGKTTCLADFMTIGRCTSIYDPDQQCAYEALLCEDPDHWQFNVLQGCDVRKDGRTQKPNYYGACANAAADDALTCVLHESECRRGEEDFVVKAESCTCEHVITGYCANDNDLVEYCAMDADACDADSYWVSARDAQVAGVHCHLCGPKKTEPDFVVPAPEIVYANVDTQVLNSATGNSSSGSTNDSGNNAAGLASGLVVGLLAVPLVLYGLVWMRKRRENAAMTAASGRRHNMIVEQELRPYTDGTEADFI